MRAMACCCLLLLSACQQQPHHRAADPALVAELADTISALLPELPQAPAAGNWIEKQATMLALAAHHDPERIQAIDDGTIPAREVQRQGDYLISALKRQRPGAKAPQLLTFLKKKADLTSSQAVLLYCLIIQATNEADLKEINQGMAGQ